ncbi:MobQ family relaxase [Acidiphilium multivorum]|uniref:MobQ family relaxase n=1 Tax=Acidiphilium multivorum TaxID=62140 RepID=UPI0039C9A0F1
MAIFHMRAQVISRAAGRSAIAAAAYRAGERLRDERTGQMHDYSRKAYVEYREILAPETAPAWMRDRAALWSGVEAAEKRKDAQLAREVHFALPRELDKAQRLELIRDFCEREFVARGMIADVAIHNPSGRDGGEQPHAHVMLTTRVLTGEGFGPKERSWNDKSLYEGWRERWADYANRSLERIGCGERIDHRSFAERGIDREPEPKLGPKAARLERHEQQAAANENRPAIVVTERGQEWRAVQERNRRRDELRGRVEVIARGLQQAVERAVVEARARLEAVRERFERTAAMIREWIGRERAVGELGQAGRPMGAEPERPQAENRQEPQTPMSRDRLFGRETKEMPAPDRLRAETAQRSEMFGRGKVPVAGKEPDRRALLGKVEREAANRQASTPGDLLGRKPGQVMPDRTRDDGGRGRS